MTCIVGLVNHGKIWMGGDSAGVSGYSIVSRLDEKVFINGEFIIGFTSSFRMGQLLRYKFVPPKQTKKQDDMSFLATSFVDAIRDCFRDGGYGKTPERSEHKGGTFLLGYRKKLYSIQEDFQISLSSDDYDACGCGTDLALGSMFSTAQSKMKPDDRIKLALEASCKFSAGVRAPFTILSL